MKIAFLGDIALFGKYSLEYNDALLQNLNSISEYLKGFNFVIGNLESPFSLKRKSYGAKSAFLYSDPQNIEVLKHLNIYGVNLANNHMFDYGEEGYELTIKELGKAGIKYFGSDGKNMKIELDGSRLLFNGFCCYSTNPVGMATEFGEHGLNPFNVCQVESILSDNKDFLNIISVHAGIEHVNYPHPDNIKVARKFAEIVPYVYYGHHPHVIQGTEKVKGSIIAYSLGNFCFDDNYWGLPSRPINSLSKNNRTGMILELDIENNKVENVKQTEIYISPNGIIEVLADNVSLKQYNEGLQTALERESEYRTDRNKVIYERIKSRKKLRNIVWYLKRLRPRYIKLFLQNKSNNRLFVENFKQFV